MAIIVDRLAREYAERAETGYGKSLGRTSSGPLVAADPM